MFWLISAKSTTKHIKTNQEGEQMVKHENKVSYLHTNLKPRPNYPVYPNGKDIETKVVNRLENRFVIDRGEVYDHKYKIDCIVSRFKGMNKFLGHIGLQITTILDDTKKQKDFLEAFEINQIVPRAIYAQLEIDRDSDIEDVSEVISFAIGSFTFDPQYRNELVIGLTINRNLSFTFFNIEENIKKNNSRPLTFRTKKQTMNIGEVCSVKNDNYFFIKDRKSDQEYFGHFSNITDENLKNELEKLKTLPQKWTGILVSFEYTGFEDGRRLPTAVNIKRYVS